MTSDPTRLDRDWIEQKARRHHASEDDNSVTFERCPEYPCRDVRGLLAATTPAPDDPSDAPLNDAMYECCIEPPDTEHAEHVLTALNRNGWTLTRLAPHE